MLADVLRRPVVVPDAPRFVGAVGAYKCTGSIEARPAAGGDQGVGRRFEPHPDHEKTYGRMVAAYRKIHPALVDLFEILNGQPAGGEAARP